MCWVEKFSFCDKKKRMKEVRQVSLIFICMVVEDQDRLNAALWDKVTDNKWALLQ